MSFSCRVGRARAKYLKRVSDDLDDQPLHPWRHRAFRGDSDHLETEEFAEGITELLTLANGMRTVVMCAEVLWWRCHRRLIADVLASLGIMVIHIRDAAVAERHRLDAPAHLVDGTLSYHPSI